MSAEQYQALHRQPARTKAEAAMDRWERHWAENAERDRNILKMYQDGSSLQTVADAFELHKPTIKSIVLRLGGSMRPRNQRAS